MASKIENYYFQRGLRLACVGCDWEYGRCWVRTFASVIIIIKSLIDCMDSEVLPLFRRENWVFISAQQRLFQQICRSHHSTAAGWVIFFAWFSSAITKDRRKGVHQNALDLIFKLKCSLDAAQKCCCCSGRKKWVYEVESTSKSGPAKHHALNHHHALKKVLSKIWTWSHSDDIEENVQNI